MDGLTRREEIEIFNLQCSMLNVHSSMEILNLKCSMLNFQSLAHERCVILSDRTKCNSKLNAISEGCPRVHDGVCNLKYL